MSQTRREFLETMLGGSALVSFSGLVPGFLARSALTGLLSRRRGETVLVVLQLSGGNDGLNTVVPFDHDVYKRSRRTLRWPRAKLHLISDALGLHPRMAGFKRLFDEGHLGIVQGVGYPGMSRDHKSAMRNWYTAMPSAGSGLQTGWVGRTMDAVVAPGDDVVPALFVGPIARPFAMNGARAFIPSVRSTAELVAPPAPGPAAIAEGWARAVSADRTARRNPLLDHVREVTIEAVKANRRLGSLAAAGSGGDYPDSQLGHDLRTVAQLVRADLGHRIFFTELGGGGFGGFDNHANQLGNHGAVLEQLAQAVNAFVRDLKRDRLLDRVLLMTFSEFGRTVSENGRRGTGHGMAAPVFLAGGQVRAGLIGEHPDLDDLDKDALKPHTDFRRLYATALSGWLGIDTGAALGEPFEPLPVLAG